jgi:hypothetical protein
MKEWLLPDTSLQEYRYLLFTWWDNLPEHERSEALRRDMVEAGVDISGLVIGRQRLPITF